MSDKSVMSHWVPQILLGESERDLIDPWSLMVRNVFLLAIFKVDMHKTSNGFLNTTSGTSHLSQWLPEWIQGLTPHSFSVPFTKKSVKTEYLIKGISTLNTKAARTCSPPRPPGVLTCVAPASDVAVAGLLEHPLPLHGQTGGENVTTERHALPGLMAHRSWRQAHQGQVIVVAVGVVAWVEDDLIDCVFLLVLLRDQGMVVADSDLVLLSAVSISAAKFRGTKAK